jgi:hypothetical protein
VKDDDDYDLKDVVDEKVTHSYTLHIQYSQQTNIQKLIASPTLSPKPEVKVEAHTQKPTVTVVRVQRTAAAPTWFDVGIIKGTQYIVSNYLQSSDMPLERQYAVRQVHTLYVNK